MNTNQPLVTVVIPMYNVANYILDAINSVLQQSYSHFEVLCIDDGSPDHSVALVESCTDPRVHLIRQKNRGLAGARNTGLNHANGEYIALLDADDLWHTDKLKHHVAQMQNDLDIDISYCPSLFMDDYGNKLEIGQFPKLTKITAKDILCRNPVGNGSAAVLRASFLNKIRHSKTNNPEKRIEFFDERLRQSEDIEFWLRCALTYQAKFEGVPDALTFYRINEDGLSANLDKQLASWYEAMDFNTKQHSAFFERWFSLAEAYQFRYLARRAIKSGMSHQALFFLKKALSTNVRVLTEEPKRTLSTLFCAALLKTTPKTFEWLSKRFIAKPQHKEVVA